MVFSNLLILLFPFEQRSGFHLYYFTYGCALRLVLCKVKVNQTMFDSYKPPRLCEIDGNDSFKKNKTRFVDLLFSSIFCLDLNNEFMTVIHCYKLYPVLKRNQLKKVVFGSILC